MSYELKKPYTDEQRINFIVYYNDEKHLRIVETDLFLFALEDNEIMGEKEIEIEVPDYDEEGNPIIIEYEDTETVIDYDEEGNPIGSHEITVIKHKQQTHIETITVPYPVIDPEYEEKQAAKREAEFNAEFFQTSLGYIRRAVNMANGTKKDFLSDLLPAISMSVQTGQAVNIIAYDKPDFTEEITDWTQYQHIKQATPQFIQECFLTLSNDFLPINEEE